MDSPPAVAAFEDLPERVAAHDLHFAQILVGRAVAEERCTSLYGVPTMFIAMLNDPTFEQWDLTSLRTGIMAGSPCPAEVMKQVIERMGARQISICYGMTETSPVSMQTRTDDSVERRVSTVGLVHPHLEVKIVDPDSGVVLPRGEIGEFCGSARIASNAAAAGCSWQDFWQPLV